MLDFKTVENVLYKYVKDLNNYPFPYDIKRFHPFNKDIFINNIISKWHEFYQITPGLTFDIPYNILENRKSILLHPEDMMIRYLIVEELSKHVSTDKNTKLNLNDIYNNFSKVTIPAKFIFRIDIENCYENIDHEILLNAFKNKGVNQFVLKILGQSLKVLFFQEGEIKQVNRGVLLTSKPDEYFAEFLLEEIRTRINNEFDNVYRTSDEFYFGANSINEGRKKLKVVKEILNEFGFKTNRYKTICIPLSDELDYNSFELKIVEAGATDPFLAFSLNKIPINKSPKTINNKKEILKVENYKDSILFLNDLLDSRNQILNFQKKHPKNKFLDNIIMSQPSEVKSDFLKLDLKLFSIEKLTQLKRVIYLFPKSGYYSNIAIELLVYVSKNSFLAIDRYTYGCDNPLDNYPESIIKMDAICKLSHSTILEMLHGDDIHNYQKFLLLRSLFKNETNLSFNLNNYKLESKHYNFQDDMRFYKTNPFLEKVLKEVKENLVASECSLVSEICQFLAQLEQQVK